MGVTIAVETPLQGDMRRLIAELNDYLKPLSPPEFQFQMTAEQMAEPDTTVLVARNEAGEAVGCGALKLHGDGLAEVKRMFTSPVVRGQGVGRQLLNAIVDMAAEKDVKDLKLETGATEGFEPAWRLYERGGFAPCGAFLDYPESGYSKFYERAL